MTRDTVRIPGAAVVIGIVAVVTGLLVLFAPYITTHLWWGIRGSLFALLALAVVGLIVLYAIVADTASAWVFAVVAGLGAIGWFVTHEYLVDKEYSASVTVVTDGVPDLTERAPFNVAAEQARPNLGDSSGNVVDTSYQSDQDSYSTLVEKRSAANLAGYELVLDQRVPLTGRADTPTTCKFDPAADRKLGGLFAYELGRKINSTQRWVSWDAGDAYAYCAKGTDGATFPMVVVPLTEQEGWLIVTEKPAGVALYNGHTGALTITDQVDNIPGSTYPLSLAATQRESTHAMGGLIDYIAGRVGWETTGDGGLDTNSGNDAEFTLAQGDDKQPVYVTPLTVRGSATAISAISTVPARARGTDLAKITVHKLSTAWLSPKSLDDRIRSDFQNLPNWQDRSIYEIVPTGNDTWTATLGKSQNIQYRVNGRGNLADVDGKPTTCLMDADGKKLQCGTQVGTNGNGVGVALEQQGNVPAPASGDLGGYTPQQLAELARRINDELVRRAGGQ